MGLTVDQQTQFPNIFNNCQNYISEHILYHIYKKTEYLI
ncbi:hypothetical protein DSUL_170034 [Desulfovibrionales bacterium]